MSYKPSAEFGRIRSFIWPVHPHELKKLIPMLLILFLGFFIYSTLRNIKDTLVVTASGAEAIPFIKVWVLLPMAILLTYIFTKLSNRFSQERVFYLITSGFLTFFALFTFVLYPLSDTIHFNGSADYLQQILPTGSKGFIAMYRNWTFTIFYALSELWGAIVMTVMFWGFANEVTKITEARRFYSVFGIGSNGAAIVAGQVGNFFNQQTFNSSSYFGQNAWEQTVISLTAIIILSGIAMMGIFRWLNKNVLTDPSFDGVHKTKKDLKIKKKLSMRESFTYLANSKYLLCIAVLVVSYNLVINLVEVVWKDQLYQLYPSAADYNNYMNTLTTSIGAISLVMALCMSSIMGRFGWTKTALITPVIMIITSIGFFAFLIFGEYLSSVELLLGTTPLAVAIFFGAAQNCLSKGAKYSVFDGTKEMAFIPLSHESKLKGKAAIDGVGSRLGKSGGSVIHQGLLMIFGTFTASAPYLAGFLLLMITLWIIAIRSLGRQFNALVGKKQPEAVIDPEPRLQPEIQAEAKMVSP